MTKTYQLKITLNDVEPVVWRQVVVDSQVLLPDLHKILQTTMGWTNSHLHDFNHGDEIYGQPDPDAFGYQIIDYRKVRLNSLLKTIGSFLIYNYDFGDSWEHTIALESVSEQATTLLHPVCVDGERACPPEDCGGVPGYEHLLKVMAKPKHPEYKEIIEWLPGGFDPNRFDREAATWTPAPPGGTLIPEENHECQSRSHPCHF